MYQEKKEIVLFGVDDLPLKAFVPEIKIRMNKGKAFDVKKVTSSKDIYAILKRTYGVPIIANEFICPIQKQHDEIFLNGIATIDAF